MQERKISFIGAGNMTQAIIKGLVTKQYPASLIMASNPSQGKLDDLARDCSILTTNNNNEALAFADIVVLAVKPQLMASVAQDLSNSAELNNKVLVSIAAGIETKRLSEMFAGHANVVRVMPNTPSAIGMGMSGIFAPAKVSNSDKEFVKAMMEKVGEAIIVDKEDDINTVIAAAGSSPAYFFLIAEAMIAQSMNMGLNQAQARALVQQAMLGSAQMLKDNPQLSAETLRQRVTSKGGTTHEAVTSLQASGLSDIFAAAMQAAVDRAREMAKQF